MDGATITRDLGYDFRRLPGLLQMDASGHRNGGSLDWLYGITGTQQDQLCHFGILDLLWQMH